MDRRIGLLCVVVASLGPVRADAPNSDWPIWSGPNGDLTHSGNDVFSKDSFGLELAWCKPLGSGYSAIVVVGDRLVTAFSDGASDFLVALDATTGAELWRSRMGVTFEGKDGSDDGPVATPSVCGGLVYGLCPRGRLFALRLADGQEIWSRRLVDELGALGPYYGFNSTPTVIDDVLVMQTGGPNGRAVSGFDPKTGTILWSTQDDGVGYQSPTKLHLGDETLVFGVTNRFILGLRPKTGELLFKHEHRLDDGEGAAHPVLSGNGRVLLSEWPGSMLVRVAKSASGYTIEERWRARELKGTYTTPVPFGDYVYGFNGRFLVCIDLRDGKTVWKSRDPGRGSLMIVDGHLVIFTERGAVVVAEATPKGFREKTRFKALDHGRFMRPSFGAKKIYVRNLAKIAALRIVGVPFATEETPEVELLGQFGAFVREVQGAENKRQRIDSFLKTQHEFPIVEGDFVHFVYRGETEDIALTGNMLPHEEQIPLQRIAGSDVYFRSMILEPGAIFLYAFTIYEDRKLDPLNPNRMELLDLTRSGGFSFNKHSVVTTRGWKAPTHLQLPQGHAGRIVEFSWRSQILKHDRIVKVYLPRGYHDSNVSYPLLLVHFGTQEMKFGMMHHTLDNLIGKSVAPLIAAFVPRWTLDEFESLADAYSRALAEELVPQLDAAFRTNRGPEARAVMGVSIAARGSIYTALNYPHVFGKVALQSCFMDRMEAKILALVEKQETCDLEVYMEWSKYDFPVVSEKPVDARAESQRLADKLKTKGFRVIAHEVPHGIGWSGWRQTNDRLLQAIFPNR